MPDVFPGAGALREPIKLGDTSVPGGQKAAFQVKHDTLQPHLSLLYFLCLFDSFLAQLVSQFLDLVLINLDILIFVQDLELEQAVLRPNYVVLMSADRIFGLLHEELATDLTD